MILRHLGILLRGTFRGIGKNTLECIRGKHILYHIAAIVVTVPLVLSGADWTYFSFFKEYLFLQVFLFPAVAMGGSLPFIIPLYLYRRSLKERKPEYKSVAIALLQASLIALIIISAYKGVTGRPPPELMEHDVEPETGGSPLSRFFDDDYEPDGDEDYSRVFRFGILRGGIFHGWPSGHTTTAFAMAYTMIHLYPENKQIRKWAIIYASYIGFGVSSNIHWLSDAVAGVFVGIVIGTVVGNHFHSRIHADTILE